MDGLYVGRPRLSDLDRVFVVTGVLNLVESAAYAQTLYGPRYMFVHSRTKEPH